MDHHLSFAELTICSFSPLVFNRNRIHYGHCWKYVLIFSRWRIRKWKFGSPVFGVFPGLLGKFRRESKGKTQHLFEFQLISAEKKGSKCVSDFLRAFWLGWLKATPKIKPPNVHFGLRRTPLVKGSP